MSRLLLPVALHLVFGVVLCAQRPMASHEPTIARARAASPPPAVVARVNGTPVMGDRLALAIDALLPVASYHSNLSPEKMVEVRQHALRNLIDEELQYQDAVQLKVVVPAADVERGLAKARAGYKTPRAFHVARRKHGVPLSKLRFEIRRALMIRRAYERRVLALCDVTELQAADFYRENPARFVIPEQHRLSLITIGVDPSAPKDAWTQAREQADRVVQQAKAGAAFDELARRYSTDPSRDGGGDLGYVHEGRMAEEFEAALRPLKPGEVSGVIQTIYGYHVVKLTGVKSSEQRTFEQVKDSLQRDLRDKRCTSMNDEWTAGLRARARVELLDTAGPRDTSSR